MDGNTASACGRRVLSRWPSNGELLWPIAFKQSSLPCATHFPHWLLCDWSHPEMTRRQMLLRLVELSGKYHDPMLQSMQLRCRQQSSEIYLFEYPSQALQVSELDPDAPGRQRRPLHPENLADEERILSRLWRLIRAGSHSITTAPLFDQSKTDGFYEQLRFEAALHAYV